LIDRQRPSVHYASTLWRRGHNNALTTKARTICEQAWQKARIFCQHICLRVYLLHKMYADHWIHRVQWRRQAMFTRRAKKYPSAISYR